MQSFRSLNHTYKFEKTIYTNISSEYLNDSGSKWGVYEALRESTQNILDEAEYQSDTHGGQILDYCQLYLYSETGYKPWTKFELRDKGRGVDFEQIMLIGESGKRGTSYRGQKGEGESLSFLVAVREGISKWMFSKDWACSARFENYLNSEYKVLVFDLYRTNKNILGTVIRYQLTDAIEDYYHSIGNYFPELSRREMRRQDTEDKKAREEQKRNSVKKSKAITQEKITSSKRSIITPRKDEKPSLFVGGVYVKKLYSLFSYNLQHVEINRDRSMVDEWQILEQIQVAFNSEDLAFEQAKKYWKNATDDNDSGLLEYKTIINFSDNRDLMLRAFEWVFGKKACLFTEPIAAINAETFGIKVLKFHPYVKDTALSLGIKTDRHVVGYEGDILPMKKIDNKVRLLVEKLGEIGKAMGFKDYPIVPVLKVLGIKEDSLCGMYKAGTIYILKNQFEGSRVELLKTYLHEAGHGQSGASDGTREFVEWFEGMLAEALLGSHDDVRQLIIELREI